MKNLLILLLIFGVLISSVCDSATGSVVKISGNERIGDIISVTGEKGVGRVVNVNRMPDKTCALIDIPYERGQQYKSPLKYEVVNSNRYTVFKGFELWAVGEVTVRNVDSEPGLFNVSQKFTARDGRYNRSQIKYSEKYIMPGELAVFREEYYLDWDEYFNAEHEIQPPAKILTRNLTFHRRVEQCK